MRDGRRVARYKAATPASTTWPAAPLQRGIRRDAAGNRTTTENASVTVTVSYDDLNRGDDVTTNYKV